MRQGRFADKAFSLLEVIVALFILGLAVSVGTLTFNTSVSNEQSRGLAYSLGAELRAARATAMQSEMFVAVCIPNDGTGNPFSRSFAVRGGYDRGRLLRTVNFEDDLSAAVFTGRWPGDTVERFDGLPEWLDESDREYRLTFRPDGTAFSQELPRLDGRYHFVVASRMSASGQALVSATSPTTIWVSEAGTVGVLENELPTGNLPEGGDVPVAAALPSLAPEDSGMEPRVHSVDFLPLKLDELENVGLGQTAVQIHPQQKRQGLGQDGVEYGLTTFRFRATDADGGPLRFSIVSKASEGEPGNFSYEETASALGPTTGGQMNFVQTDEGEWLWESVISWRPPPGALMNTAYDFTLTVEDPEGNLTEVASGAELLPRIVLLRPENLVYETADEQLVITNLDGTSHRLLTQEDQPESEPFFSSDGTRLYSFFKAPDELAVITRNSDGTQRKKLQSFPSSYFRKLTFDPFKNYAAYLAGSSINKTVPYQTVDSREETVPTGIPDDPNTVEDESVKIVTVYFLVDGSSEISINRLEVMHLNSGKKVNVSEHAQANFKWYGNPRFGLSFREIDIFDNDDKLNPPAQDPLALQAGVAENLPRYIPSPGYQEADGEVVIRGYPPVAEPQDLPDFALGVEKEIFNLARPRYYLESKTAAPHLKFKDITGTLPARTLVDPEVESPSWSNDGRYVLYAREGGGEVKICRQKVLNDTLDGLELGGEEVLHSDSGIRTPQLSSSGEYAFFLKGGDIFRIEVDNPGAPINLTKNLDKNVRSFVLSP